MTESPEAKRRSGQQPGSESGQKSLNAHLSIAFGCLRFTPALNFQSGQAAALGRGDGIAGPGGFRDVGFRHFGLWRFAESGGGAMDR